MKTLTTITYNLDERFRLEFTNDWEGKYYHLQIINGDLTPLCYIPPASSGSVLCISGIPTGYSSYRIYELLVKNTYWIGKIYLLDAPKLLMNKIEEVKACNEDFGLSFAIEKNNANNIQGITPNLSKYIPEDNAVLFLSEKSFFEYVKIFQGLDLIASLEKGIMGYKKITIFIPHGTLSELQKANEVDKELKEKYGVKEVKLFVLHCFTHLYGGQDYVNAFIKKANDDISVLPLGKSVNKIITTSSTGILKPEDSSERLQIIDAKEIFEEYLNGNNLIQTL